MVGSNTDEVGNKITSSGDATKVNSTLLVTTNGAKESVNGTKESVKGVTSAGTDPESGTS